MDPQRFDLTIQKMTAAFSRRRFAGLFAVLGGAASLGPGDGSEAKKRKKKKRKKRCKPKCTGGATCKRRTCVCPSGRTLCDEQCIPNDACCAEREECDCPGGQKPCGAACIPQDNCCNDEDCGNGATCQDGVCNCPAGEEVCDGVCTATDRVCEELCCPVDVECFVDGCSCEEFVCRCAEERTYCSTPDFTQCCAPGDNCDPIAACTTHVCSAENDICTSGSAFCDGGFCLCTTSAGGTPFCADFDALEDCPAESTCADDTECGSGEICAHVPCCGEDDAFFGICLPPCAETLRARARNTERAAVRRRLERALKLEVAWSRSHSGAIAGLPREEKHGHG